MWSETLQLTLSADSDPSVLDSLLRERLQALPDLLYLGFGQNLPGSWGAADCTLDLLFAESPPVALDDILSHLPGIAGFQRIPYQRIEVVVHPQSIVHSMVTFTDGSTLAQASPPDMKLPISLALGWPSRVPQAVLACGFSTASTWEFEPLDAAVFPAVELAREAGSKGGCLTAIYNAANEEAAEAFLAGRIRFPAIVRTIAEVLCAADQWAAEPATVEDVLDAQHWARDRAKGAVSRRVVTIK